MTSLRALREIILRPLRGIICFTQKAQRKNTQKRKEKVQTNNNKQRTKNKEHLCHHRIVATAFTRGLGTQDDKEESRS